MNDNTNELMAEQANEFMALSQQVLEDAMASCQMEAFTSVTLNIPQDIYENSLPREPLSQDEIWKQINQLYHSQEAVFDADPLEGEESNDGPPPTTDPLSAS